MDIKVGVTIPNFTATTDVNTSWSLENVSSDYIVLYFYPKDDTPGCTKEACSFRDLWSQFADLDATIIGVSRDAPESHQAFKSKYNLPLTLLSDTTGVLCKQFGVIKDKTLLGKLIQGLERSTFLLDKNRTVVAVWRDVTVDGHSEQIMQAIQEDRRRH